MNSIIQTPTNNLEESVAFYKKLNFEIRNKIKPTLVCGGSYAIEINPERTARTGLKFYQKSWSKEVEHLKKLTTVLKIESGYLAADTSGVFIYLIEGESQIKLNDKKIETSLGNFAGLSLETISIHSSKAIFEILGFEDGMGNADQGWLTMSNADNFSVSFMAPNACPHLFFNPSLTFFNGKEGNPKVIQKIRDLKIPISEEITHFNKEGLVDNIIIRDPGGLGFFLFND